MRIEPNKLLVILALVLSAAGVPAAPKAPFAGPDFSGTYDCKGDDSHEGAYTSTVTLQLVRDQSIGRHGAYAFRMDVPGFGTYLGHAASNERMLAIHFALTDPLPKDYGTGIARVSKGPRGKWQFSKYYYEPEFKGGNHGTETCTLK